MILPTPIATLTDTLFPYTTLFRSNRATVPSISASVTSLSPSVVIGMIRVEDAFNMHPRGTGSRRRVPGDGPRGCRRSEEHTSELQSLMSISYAVLCLKKKKHYRYDIEMTQPMQLTNQRIRT